MIKTCRVCNVDKPIEDFSKRSRPIEGQSPNVRSYCKTCHNKKSRLKYAGGQPEPLTRTYTRMTEKVCKICEEQKTVELFIPNTRTCKACSSKKQKAQKALDPNVKYPTKPRFDEQLGVDVKACSKCRIEKPLEAFGQGAKRIRSQCKECDRATLAASRKAKPREEWLLQQKIHNAKRRAKSKAYKAANREKARLQAMTRRKNNPLPTKEARFRRYARKRGAPVVERISRKLIIERDNSTCYLCSRVLAQNEITLDHVVPVSRGGHHTNANLRVACRPCNSGKRDLLLDEYLATRIVLP